MEWECCYIAMAQLGRDSSAFDIRPRKEHSPSGDDAVLAGTTRKRSDLAKFAAKAQCYNARR